jgi:membrane associated rhomboid family serine protease
LAAGALLWLAVAVPSTVQLVAPGLLDALARNPDLIQDGEFWRLLTSAFVQDGGVPGTLFNLTVLGVVVVSSGPVWGGARLWLLFLVGAVGCNLLDVAFFGSTGAGNSMATFTIAAATVALALRRGEGRRAGVVRLVVLLAVGTTLLVTRDHHGFSVLLGVPLGLVVSPVSRR